MSTIAVIVTTVFKKRVRLEELLNDLSNQSKNVSEVSITFQRSPDNYFEEQEVRDFLQGFKALKIMHEIVDELNTSSGRNRAIARVSAEWIINVDDDCRYPPGSIDKIKKAVEENPDVDVLTFCSKRPSKSFSKKKFRHNRLSIRHVSLIEIVFSGRVRRLLGKKPYDENFGLGCKWRQGEEQILLNDIMVKGGKVIHIPDVVVEHEDQSSGYVLTPESISARGAIFRRMYGYGGLIISILFILKKTFDGKLGMNICKGLSIILRGFRQYKG